MKQFLKEAAKRFVSTTPAHFKKIIYASIGVGGMGGGLKTAVEAGVHFPTIITTHIGHMIAVGVIGALVAKQACIAPPQPPDPPKQ